MSDSDNTVSGWERIRPYSRARHYAGLLSPSAATAGHLFFERGVDQRIAHLRAAASARAHRRRAAKPTMRSLVAGPGGSLRWRDLPIPDAPGPSGAVVHPLAIATCDMDRPIMLGATPFPLPLHLGHECVAEVISVGESVRDVEVGQTVVLPFQINCGTCIPCRQGRTANCEGVPPSSMFGFGLAGGLWGGVMADQVGVPFADAMLVPLPSGIDPVAAASVADNVSDAYRHIAPHLPKVLAADPHATILIIAGTDRRPIFTPSVPLYAGLVALALGAPHVVLVDSRPSVRRLAVQLGLDAVEPSGLKTLPPAALTVDLSAAPDGLAVALRHTAPDGICSSAGGLRANVRFPMLDCFGHNVTLHVGRTHARAIIPDVLALMADGRLQPERVTTNVSLLDHATTALEEHCRLSAIKTILTAP